MTEHLIVDERKLTETASGNVDLVRLHGLDLRTVASFDLGVRSVSLLHSLDMTDSAEHLDTFNDPIPTGGTEHMTNNQEGMRNAELFKRMYDAAVTSIDDALEGSIDELDGKIPTILSNIDALLATPYISSAPEFVGMVKAARSSIEATSSFGTLGGEDVNLTFANLLSQARRQLGGTLIAYRPQR